LATTSKPGGRESSGRGRPSYRQLADTLRRQIEAGEYADGRQLPTELELQQEYSVSRHTVREALQQLTADGLIYRVPGRGTFASGRQSKPGRYLRSIGSLDEIITWPETDMEVVEPFRVEVNPSIAARLELTYIEVSRATVRRLYKGVPFVITRHYVAPDLGEILRAHDIPSRGEGTVIGAAEQFLPAKIAGARQDITAMNAPADEAKMIRCEPGDAILLIERLFYDTTGRFIEFTQSHFNPRLYAYRMDLRRRSM
jgi:DNA-binding GntR family transcriptional regulator